MLNLLLQPKGKVLFLLCNYQKFCIANLCWMLSLTMQLECFIFLQIIIKKNA